MVEASWSSLKLRSTHHGRERFLVLEEETAEAQTWEVCWMPT